MRTVFQLSKTSTEGNSINFVHKLNLTDFKGFS